MRLKPKFVCILSVLLAAVLSGCSVHLPFAVTPNTITEDAVVSTSSRSLLFGFIGWGDSSINAALKNGNITKVQYVDLQCDSFLGIFTKYSCKVYGDRGSKVNACTELGCGGIRGEIDRGVKRGKDKNEIVYTTYQCNQCHVVSTVSTVITKDEKALDAGLPQTMPPIK